MGKMRWNSVNLHLQDARRDFLFWGRFNQRYWSAIWVDEFVIFGITLQSLENGLSKASATNLMDNSSVYSVYFVHFLVWESDSQVSDSNSSHVACCMHLWSRRFSLTC